MMIYFCGIENIDNIEKIIFEDTTKNIPSGAVDVSVAGDGGIVRWVDGTEIHIASDGIICASESAGFLFCELNINEIQNLNLLDMSNVTEMAAMFEGCGSLTSIDLSNFDTSNVTDMSNMFGNCSSLTSIDLGSFDTSNVTDMSVMFEGCGSLTSIDLGSFDTSNVTDMAAMFEGCGSLTSIDLGSFDTSNVTDMSNMFANCSSLKKIYAKNNFNIDKVRDDENMFYLCTSLVGGNGTTYNESYVDKTYARIDTDETLGYFTLKNGK